MLTCCSVNSFDSVSCVFPGGLFVVSIALTVDGNNDTLLRQFSLDSSETFCTFGGYKQNKKKS